MTPEITFGLIVTIIIAVIGYLLKSKNDLIDNQIAALEKASLQQLTQQARDEVKWDQQQLVNNKVDISREQTVILKSQVNTIHSSIDDLKSDFKEIRTDLKQFIADFKNYNQKL